MSESSVRVKTAQALVAEAEASSEVLSTARRKASADGVAVLRGASPRKPLTPAELEEREMDRKAAESLARMDGGCYL